MSAIVLIQDRILDIGRGEMNSHLKENQARMLLISDSYVTCFFNRVDLLIFYTAKKRHD